jgi:hypothetical protein
MAQLISPNVDVTIIDESFYIPGQATALPLFFIATADEKKQLDGETPAIGTYEYGVLRTVTSIKQALELYGVPKYYQSAGGLPHHGDVRNEYGLDALLKFLEIGNRAYVIRANVNLDDTFTSIRALWLRKIQIAGDILNQLVSDWLLEYNTANGYLVNDPEYKRSVSKTVMIDLVNQALIEALSSYSFSSDEFRVAFLQDHSVAQPGYQDIVFESFSGFIQATDITGLDADQLYGASIRVTHTGGTNTYNLNYDGENIVTFGDLIDSLNASFAGAATATLFQGRIRITSNLAGPTSEVTILADGISGRLPLFGSCNLFERLATPVSGVGINPLAVYNDTFTTVVGNYIGLYGLVDDWTGGGEVNVEFTPTEAEGLLISAATTFDNTREFRNLTSLGANDAARRNVVVQQLQAIINNPTTGARAESLEYNILACPGFPEVTDELVRLSQDMLEEVFVVGETPFDKPPTGPNSIVAWAVSPARVTSYHAAYWYGHGISSNIDGKNILTTAAATAVRVLAYNDAVAEPWFAPAGTQRGLCPHLVSVGYVSGTLGGPTTFVEEFLNTGTRDELYEFPKNINPIAFIPGRGILVMGQKTVASAQSALDRVNVSRLLKYIKRNLRKGLFPYLFEPNDKITRDNVKASVDGFLATLVDRRGLYDFATIVDETNNTPETIDRNELYIDIAIKPVKAIEFIYARIRVVRTGANIGTGKTVP